MQMQMLTSNNTAAHFDPGILELSVYQGQSLQYHGIRAFPTVLNLASNNLTGAIPQEIGQLKMLLSLNISHNNLFKQIPQSICNPTDLEVLDLSSNHLTGAIPVALNNLHFLSQFRVANNDLEGPIPNEDSLAHLLFLVSKGTQSCVALSSFVAVDRLEHFQSPQNNTTRRSLLQLHLVCSLEQL
jgi:Leucine-rich repeat (LRR) protein